MTLESAKSLITDGLYISSDETLESDYEYSLGEFIFIIDRSGSMDGSRMEMAIMALVSFLD